MPAGRGTIGHGIATGIRVRAVVPGLRGCQSVLATHSISLAIAVGACLTGLFEPGTALAHAPYERIDRFLVAEDDRWLTIVLSYQDGIIGADPVKLVVRDQGGELVGETGYVRDLQIACIGDDCAAFLFDGFASIFPDEVWLIRDGRLLRSDSVALSVFGVGLPLWDHALSYFVVVVALLVAPLVACVRWLARSKGLARRLLLVFLVAILVPYAVFWAFLIPLGTGLSLGWMIVLTVSTLLAVRLLRRRPRFPCST
ncbi:MAG: hypothetical protein FJX72_10620 [Armatimonadetes bacterium]|nr:hypothetical protein [Armatimonadota bacterium]